MAPDLKMTFRVSANYVPSIMLLSQSTQSAQRKCLVALLNKAKCIIRWFAYASAIDKTGIDGAFYFL